MLKTDNESVQLSNAWTAYLQRSPALVAHALGSYAAPNSLSGFRHSLAQGSSLFEVDVYLDRQNILRCHHGPDIPKPIRSGECELGSLLKLVPEHRFLILDIKTDFVRTADRVIGLLASPLYMPYANRLIFQLYTPDDLHWFAKTARQNSLIKNKAILTLYRTRLNPVFANVFAPRFIGAVTFPAERLGMQNYLLAASRVSLGGIRPTLVHPVKSCWEFEKARLYSIQGVYGPASILGCKGFRE